MGELLHNARFGFFAKPRKDEVGSYLSQILLNFTQILALLYFTH